MNKELKNTSELQDICEELIRSRIEGAKVDLKTKISFNSKKNIAELAKLVSAIANTDSAVLGNVGYIILGAKRGELTGGLFELAKDNTSANLQKAVNNYLTPPVDFEVFSFKDDKVGYWGVVVVPESVKVPHFIAREYSDEKESVFKKNECYVRRGDSTGLSGPEDFNRMYIKKLKGFEERLSRLEEAIISKKAENKPELHLSFLDKDNRNLGRETEISLGYYPNKEVAKALQVIDDMFAPKRMSVSEDRSRHQAAILSSILGVHRKDSATYKKELKEYYRDVIKRRTLRACSFELKLGIGNRGEKPASDVLVIISFPGCKAYKDDDFLTGMEKPKIDIYPPLKGISTTDYLKESSFPKSVGVKVKNTSKDTEVRFEIEKAKHKLIKPLPEVYLTCPTDKKGYSELKIPYKIHCDQLPELVKGNLKLMVKIDLLQLNTKKLREMIAKGLEKI